MALGNSAASRPDPFAASRNSIEALWDQSIAWLLGHYLQIGIALLVGALLVTAMLGLRSLASRFCRRHPSLTHWPHTIGRVVVQTHLAFMVLLACKLVDGYANAPDAIEQTINVLFTIAAAIQGAVWVRELVLSVIEHRAGDDDNGTLGSAIGIIRLLVTIVVFAIATVLILDNLGVNVTGLVAGLGIGGIAIGLAAKGIFDDLFSALSIIFDKPFRRGDTIRWDQTSGTVEAIGLKTTRVRAISGEEVVISNTNLLAKELHNMARLARRRITIPLRIAAYTPAEACARVPHIVKRVVEAQDKCTLVRCGLLGFGSSSLDFELQFDVHSEIYDEVFNAQHAVCIGILEAFAAEEIDFAFPTQVAIAADQRGNPKSDVTGPAAPRTAATGAGSAGEVAPE